MAVAVAAMAPGRGSWASFGSQNTIPSSSGGKGFMLFWGSYALLLQRCSKTKALLQGKQLHGHMLKSGSRPNSYVETSLVIMYVKCGSLADAWLVLGKMERHRQNVFSWTAMIGGYVKQGHYQEGLLSFRRMQLAGVKPNSFTVATILPACANLEALDQGKQMHAFIIRSGFESDVFVGSCLVDLYAKCRNLDDARQMFDKMSQRNLVSWNAMIAGYAQNGRADEGVILFRQMQLAGFELDVVSWNVMMACCRGHEEAMKLFCQMQRGGTIKPDPITITTLLPACADLAALEHGRQIHAYTIGSGFESDVYIGSAFVDMYAKCGSLKDAHQVFDKMSQRNVVSWSAMIGGYAMHGHAEDALALFSQMQKAGMEPNHITFTGVLSACSHAGLVNEGWQYFNSISRDYFLTPSLEHYACMVDLLGRSGQLEKALNFITLMPSEPDSYVWGALLGACRIHCNVEIGERVAERLFELDPENTGNYVLLSNIYASAGRWDEVANVRRMMEGRGLEKSPGCSWIEVKNKMHVFFVGDRSHPQTQKIYATLESLAAQMTGAGYVPDTSFVLCDLGEEEKQYILCGHVEKSLCV